MMKLMVVAVLAGTLMGCVKYTNDKGEDCTANINPVEWAYRAVLSAGTGENLVKGLNRCKPAPEADEKDAETKESL